MMGTKIVIAPNVAGTTWSEGGWFGMRHDSNDASHLGVLCGAGVDGDTVRIGENIAREELFSASQQASH